MENKRSEDEYLDCPDYLGHADSPSENFVVFQKASEYYFAMISPTGEVLLRSEGYPTVGARDNGLASVLKNRELPERYSIVEDGDEYFVSLKAGNHKEIARSCPFVSEEAALKVFGFIKGEGDFPWLAVAAAAAVAGNNDDEYLDCADYLGHEDTPAEGFRTFSRDGENYFVLLDAQGGVLLRSESYPSTGARDNGIVSVQKNRELPERYSIVEEDGKYLVILKAGNHKEIARSCPFESEAAALNIFGFIKGEGGHLPWLPLVAAAAAVASGMNEDEYLDCADYLGHEDTPAEGFRTFSKDGENYFTMVSPAGEVLLRSEGYPSAGARDNGLASVQKNRELPERYSVVEDNGEYFVVLRAANHKEIARSCPFESEAAALSTFGFIKGEGGHLPWLPLVAAAAAVASGMNEDEYLNCAEYQGHADAPAEGFRIFSKDGENYFAMVSPAGEVLLRSEGYPTPIARDNGLASVLKNRELPERYSIEEDNGEYFVVLRAANHKEIARSCPYESEAAAKGAFSFIDQPGSGRFPWLALSAAVPLAKVAVDADTKAGNEVVAEVVAEKKPEDNYLPCKKYVGHESSLNDGFVTFKFNGLYYFALINEDTGKVLFRSQGYASPAARDESIAAVKIARDIKERYEEVDSPSGHYFIIMKSPDNEELVRSCGYRDRNALWALFPFLAAGGLTAFPWQIPGLTGSAPVITPIDYEPKEEKTKSGMAAAGAAAAVGTAAAAAAAKDDKPKPVAAAYAETGGGGAGSGGGIPRWLWALLAALLLGLLLWWLLKGCDGKKAEQPINNDMPAVVSQGNGDVVDGQADTLDMNVPPPTTEEEKTEPEPAAAANVGGVDCGCDTGREPLFMRYAYEPKTLTHLGTNPEFGDSHALSPAEFYDKLNNAYNSNETDRQFLDRIFRSMGYRNGWSDATPGMFSNTTVPYGTVGNIGYAKSHRTQYSRLNLGERDQRAFLIKARNGCDVRFMKTCGNHMFYCD